jgi:hypothetical protein
MMPGGPERVEPAASQDAAASPAGGPRPGPMVVPYPEYRWYHKAGALMLAVFCMSVGIFLILYPWTESWDRNYFAALVPEWHQYWENLYVRGAVTGLGFANFYISLSEVFRLRRFSRR